MRFSYIHNNSRIYFLIFIAVFVIGYRTFSYSTQQLDSFLLYQDFKYEDLDENQICKLPLLHPFEKEVISYFKPPLPLKCKSSVPVLTFVDDNGILRFNTTAFEESGYTSDILICHYQEIIRDGDKDDIIYKPAQRMTGYDFLTSDFVYVACSRNSWLPNTYAMFHANAKKSQHVRDFRSDHELGVVVIGIDSMSRLNFMRQLPRSYDTITNTLQGVVLTGFNKVGYNTLNNIVPILTGSPPGNTSYSFQFDNWPFIWNELNADNVATFYGEDLSRISTFSWWGAGFKNGPTTHYFHPFWLAADRSALNSWSSTMCLGSLPKHVIYLNYLKSFLKTYKDGPVFMFSLENEPSHDFLNTVGVIDVDLNNFLVESYKSGLFNRSVVFVLGDHGNRMDNFRTTWQGKIEDVMPMVSVILPPWLILKRPDLYAILKTNHNRLSSSYDLYNTFVDIFEGYLLPNKALKNKKKYNFSKAQYGQSLFKTISLKRTCSDAGIPEMYCACTEETKQLADNDILVQKSLNITISYINDQILNSKSEIWKNAQKNFKTTLNMELLKKCAQLTVKKIDTAHLVVKPGNRQLVHLNFWTNPNDALFESRVEWTGNVGKIHEEILRINRYGSQPDCLDRAQLLLVPFVRSVCKCL